MIGLSARDGNFDGITENPTQIRVHCTRQARDRCNCFHLTCNRMTGVFSFLSYRDPNLLKSLLVYDGTSDFLRVLELDGDTLTKEIIGTIGDLDSYQLQMQSDITGIRMLLPNPSIDIFSLCKNYINYVLVVILYTNKILKVILLFLFQIHHVIHMIYVYIFISIGSKLLAATTLSKKSSLDACCSSSRSTIRV
ncbi:presequence protease 1, chloroplastic/mitochondrial-like [Iris pallida]|uniref:Presequence protease 1, chloroplastic/mitochondrial-like n=1 Tax=Iris pallida TaxID=29817 RepID=A0AAX6HNB3_IRIPA|nr:presequence protease 1, chloroplastic/mitochondrial-like [Iris pallida]